MTTESRKRVIYETTGRAAEFNELALNLFDGCSHGCSYCWVPEMKHVDRESFVHPHPRVTPVEIAASARMLQKAGEKRPVLLCFTSDPYHPEEAESQLTRQAITVLHAHGLKVVILTKGGLRATRDFDLLGPGDQFATTLTCVDAETSRHWEPGAALPEDRIKSLIQASSRGIETWVSLEPVIYPSATRQLVLLTRSFVGHYKVGTMNYHPWAARINWKIFGWGMKRFLDAEGVKYYLKRDLLNKMGALR